MNIGQAIYDRRLSDERHVEFSMFFRQGYYGDKDAQFAFGAIDNLQIAADFDTRTAEIWFEDTYEWHPSFRVYGCPEVQKRDTHFLHAAMVQMKTRGAADFQMHVEVTFQMSLFPAATGNVPSDNGFRFPK
jgi:hypothetical protein